MNLTWSTGNGALDHYIMPTLNNNSPIQIGGPAKGQCGTRDKANSARNGHAAPALTSQWSLFSQQPKTQWEQELSTHHLKLDTNGINVLVCSAVNVSLSDKGEVPVYSVSFQRLCLTTSGHPTLLQDVGLLCLGCCEPNIT